MSSEAAFPVNPVLTGVALAYKNAKMIADDVAPRHPVPATEFKYHRHELADKITTVESRVGRKSAPNELEFGSTEETASIDDHGLDDVVPQADIDKAKNIPGHDPLAQASENLTDVLMLLREVRTANLVFNPDNYHADNKTMLAGNAKWSDKVNSTPVDDISAAVDGAIIRPNTMVLGMAVWTVLKSHPAILSAIGRYNSDSGIAKKSEVAELFELDEVIVGEGWLNIAAPGQMVQRARVWGSHCSLMYRDKLANFSNNRPTFALTAEYGTRISGEMPEPKIGLKGSTRVRVGEQVKELILANDMAYLFENAA